ncbi:MAG: M20 family metallopeptidase [Negativicutes bacterium]
MGNGGVGLKTSTTCSRFTDHVVRFIVADGKQIQAQIFTNNNFVRWMIYMALNMTSSRSNVRECVLKTLHELIAYQSINPPGDENQLAECVGRMASELGADVTFQEVLPGRKNIIAQWTFGPGLTHLLFNAHLDVVPPTPGVWFDDPFKMVVIDEKAYGRGACDTKGSLASMLTGIILALSESKKLDGKLTLTGVIGEETGGIGTQYFVRNLKPTKEKYLAVVGEPTGLDIVIAHKGISRRKIIIRGKAAHASDPAAGDNAIYTVAKIAVEIEKLNEQLSFKKNPLLGSPCVSATVIKGGVKDNVIPDYCELSIDRRRIPGEDKNILDIEIEKILEKIAKNADYTIEDLGSDKEPVEISNNEAIVQLAQASIYQALGRQVEPTIFIAGTDMPFLVQEGRIPTIVLGPGYLAQAHTVNEFVPVEQLVDAVQVYASIIVNSLR